MGSTVIISSLLAISITLCYGLPWDIHEDVPVELREMSAEYEEESSATINNVKRFEELMEQDSFFDINEYKVEVKLMKMVGGSCGSPDDPVIVNKLIFPKVIVFGENATFGADVTIKKNIATATLMKVVVQKVGSLQIPCLDNIGTCNYTNPCDLLNQFKCPPEIIKAGWNCRCPLVAAHFAPPPITMPVPQIPLPGFLINGVYNVEAQLFNGDEELFCYKLTVTLQKD